MCGIAGIIDYKKPIETYKSELEKFQSILKHRGPDGQNLVLLKHAGLVHTRLAIVDPLNGEQPIFSADRKWAMVFNGEIYNYRELRRELKSWNFKTQCDSEVLLAAWVAWGKESIKKLNGMFAFFIWNQEEKTGYLVRDLLGVKPLSYTCQNNVLAFASEAKALVNNVLKNPRVNQEQIFENITAPYFSGVSESPFQGINYLQPGELLQISPNGMKKEIWGNYVFELNEKLPDLTTSITDAVKLCLSDVESGVFLSGGFDSSLITTIANKTRRLPAWTIRYDNQKFNDVSNSSISFSDDSPYAEIVAKELGIDHEFVDVSHDDLTKTIRELAVINDALPAWEQEFSQYFLAKQASKNLKVVLVGDAADELNYGYHFLTDNYATQSPLNILNRFSIEEAINKSNFPEPFKYFEDKYKKLSYSAGYNWNNKAEKILATTYLIIKRWLPRLLHNGDIHTMNFGLEARVPFADINLINQTRTINPNLAFTHTEDKKFLRNSVKGLLNEEIRNRKKSALPKDKSVGIKWQALLKELIKSDSVQFLSHFYNLDYLKKASELPAIDEKTQSLIFRVITLAEWQKFYGVTI